MTTPPEKQFYQNGCPLACVAWHLRNLGISEVSQEGLFETYKDHFPAWNEEIARGALDRVGLVKLIGLLPYSLRNYTHTQSHDDALHLFHIHNQNYMMGFLIHRKPTNHVLAIVGFADVGIRVMEPSAGVFQDISYVDCVEIHDADYLLFFSPYLVTAAE